MVFADRDDAARRLAKLLASHRGARPLVLAIPRGAVPMGRVIADVLEGELDVVLVRKLGAPHEPEYAVGSVDEDGHVTRNPDARGVASEAYLADEARRQLAVIRERRRRYTPVRAPIDPEGRVAIVVDDGVATGSTLLAALHAVRRRRPGRLIAAVGVAPTETVARLRAAADEVVCVHVSDEFFAVAQFFDHFPQVSDDEVVRILSERGRVPA